MLHDFMATWDDPHARHAMLIHAPIVLGVLGVLPLLALAATGFRSAPLKWVLLGWFLAASAGGWLAADAGEKAKESVERRQGPLSRLEKDVLHDHEELGENGWIWPLIPAALVGVSLVRPRKVQLIAGWLAVAASLGVGGWVATTAQAGGKLVYVHGLGVPGRGPSTGSGETN
jgi:uncharacterized membrane protein